MFARSPPDTPDTLMPPAWWFHFRWWTMTSRSWWRHTGHPVTFRGERRWSGVALRCWWAGWGNRRPQHDAVCRYRSRRRMIPDTTDSCIVPPSTPARRHPHRLPSPPETAAGNDVIGHVTRSRRCRRLATSDDNRKSWRRGCASEVMRSADNVILSCDNDAHTPQSVTTASTLPFSRPYSGNCRTYGTSSRLFVGFCPCDTGVLWLNGKS